LDCRFTGLDYNKKMTSRESIEEAIKLLNLNCEMVIT
jgi:hypothetical protein